MEKIQKMSDDPLKDCPECETPSLKKLISAAAFKLTGTGWYETDFKTKPAEKSSAEGKDKSKDSKSDASKDTKKDNNKASANESKKDSQKDNKASSAGTTKK
jgi:putative FmdB family regulatory protein